ncbi:hypothetical protein Pla52n_41820 [Stieleria varia]|uniref:Uncharacterized protein n=1 Tax=Stieleria varia TaxID=2528005 RepID=A0A5C6ALB8_9BACT|nr:hypothetical protein Pla52n_41820 [Stieleria varia]
MKYVSLSRLTYAAYSSRQKFFANGSPLPRILTRLSESGFGGEGLG